MMKKILGLAIVLLISATQCNAGWFGEITEKHTTLKVKNKTNKTIYVADVTHEKSGNGDPVKPGKTRSFRYQLHHRHTYAGRADAKIEIKDGDGNLLEKVELHEGDDEKKITIGDKSSDSDGDDN